MKFLGVIIAGALAALSQSAAAAVLFMPESTGAGALQSWGQAQTLAAQAQPFTAGPVTFGHGITYGSTNSNSVVGYTGNYGFSNNGNWAAGGAPMAGLNAAEGSMSFTFAAPVASILTDINWANGDSNGAPIFISIYDSANHLLETFELSDGTKDLAQAGYWGFSRDNADISRLVLSNGYIGARNFYTGFTGGPGGGGGAPALSLGGAVPEPGTWLLMIVGFGTSGAMLRRGRAKRLAPARVRI